MIDGEVVRNQTVFEGPTVEVGQTDTAVLPRHSRSHTPRLSIRQR